MTGTTHGTVGTSGVTTSTNTNLNSNARVNTGSTNTGATNNMNWNSEDTYWRNNYPSQPYYNSSTNYSTYEPAYRYGYDLYSRSPGRRYEDLNQTDLTNGWNQARGSSN